MSFLLNSSNDVTKLIPEYKNMEVVCFLALIVVTVALHRV